MFFEEKKVEMVEPESALRGRKEPILGETFHSINGRPLNLSIPDNMKVAIFGMGCFWGVENLFWNLKGAYLTMVGYSSGYTVNPTYQEVCTGLTGHSEVVRIVFDPREITYRDLLIIFWQSHNPTQGMRQGNDMGTQYRSGIYYLDEAQRIDAEKTKSDYDEALKRNGYGRITTEILEASTFYFAEDYHQQYLEKNPNGYCGLGGTGVSCPIGVTI